MNKNKILTVFVSVLMSVPALDASVGMMPVSDDVPYGKEFREALGLKERGVETRSSFLFESLADRYGKTSPKGYAVLSGIVMRVPGYKAALDEFLDENPHSVLVPQLVYAYALNCFDDRDYVAASEYFNKVHTAQLRKDQANEFLFKKAYTALENERLGEAAMRFKDLERRPANDYTYPSRYALGYINYKLKNFNEALKWFEKSSEDERFTEISNYYVMECRFMLKDYYYVTVNGDAMYESVAKDRKPHLARIISEAWLVMGDAEKAKLYYELCMNDGNAPTSRSDWFYSGSVLYEVGDYEGAVSSFNNMWDRTDSLGQIANYQLAYSYIQMKNKVAAMGAFKDAAEVWYDEMITEDAYFNWAKLAFDINSDTSVFNDYLKKYPTKKRGDRINSYIAAAALHDRDYEAAVRAYDKIDELDQDMVQNYIKANYLRANQLVLNGSYRMAIPCLKAAAYYSDKRTRLNQLSRYWLAESYFRNEQYDEAVETFTELYNTSALYGRPESYLMTYNIAYSYFMDGDYYSALKWFDEYLVDYKAEFRKEALLRKGDCYFTEKRYVKACEAYDLVLKDYFNVNDIYPYYQAGMSYGFAKNDDEKVRLLSNVMKASPASEFYPETLFELGRSYVAKDNDAKASECFRKLADTVKDSTYVARAYIELGSLSRNRSQYNEALGYYKAVVEDMPLSGYAEDALAAIESIYQTRNEPEEYLVYIEKIGRGGSKSEIEREMMIFNAAEQIFLSENYQKALVSLQQYLDKYPDGGNVYKADFYMAESYKNLSKFEQACDSYRKVIEKGEGSFVEASMLNFSDISFRLENWGDAFGGYSSLYSSAVLESNKRTAVIGMMRSAFRGHGWSDAVHNSDRILMDDSFDSSFKMEARYVKAKSYLATSRREEAYSIFADMAKNPSSAYGAEAAYLMILDCYDKGEFKEVEDKVYALSDAGTDQVYWLAKSFIVLGDSFVERDELKQAKATFESVRDGYTPSGNDDDVIDNVEMRLKKLAELMTE